MAKFYNDIVTYIVSLQTLQRLCLIALFFILGLLAVRITVKTYYNAKKFALKPIPIIFAVVFISIAIFIACV